MGQTTCTAGARARHFNGVHSSRTYALYLTNPLRIYFTGTAPNGFQTGADTDRRPRDALERVLYSTVLRYTVHESGQVKSLDLLDSTWTVHGQCMDDLS